MKYRNIPHDYVNEIFSYDPDTGDLTYRKDVSNKFKAGTKAGYQAKFKSGTKYYIFVTVPGYSGVILAHRLIWFIATGEWPKVIDHLDRDGCNNRFKNLRNVSRAENQRNQRMHKNNTSGTNGVSLNKKINKWIAHICDNSISIHLGAFDNIEDAIKIRKAAEVKYGYHPQHGNVAPIPALIFN